MQDRRQGLWIFYPISRELPEWASRMLDQTVMAKHVQLKSAIKLLNEAARPTINHKEVTGDVIS
ncbi:hypothetical protein [uncultured Vibrio sp.]|uniref:hypothetical protein n=1 Tax=uncultured Vibrio sp. TaxID=114054 RepID=UPI002623124E|nr:hypothetical protein [uncultured Vibrio sp.]